MAKKTNKKYTEYFFVGTGDQAMPVTGNISNAGSSVNILDGQLGVVAAVNYGTYSVGDFMADGDTIADLPAIRIVQGTPSSADTSDLYGWHTEHKAFVESPVIHANSIQSFTGKLAPVDAYSCVELSGLNVPAEDTIYAIHPKLRSVRKDRDYGANVDQMTIDYETGDLSAVTADLDLVLQNLAYKFNLQSASNNIQPDWGRIGANKRWIAFGVNSAGSNVGTAIGTIAAGDVIPVQTDGTTTMNYTIDRPMLQALNSVLTDSTTVTATSTIELLDLSNSAGEGAPATGTITITNNANIANDVYTINGTAITEGVDFAAGGSAALSATALADAINANTTISAIITAEANAAVVTLVADTGGTAGNAYTLVYTDSGSGVSSTVSGATFAGGTNTNVDTLLLFGLQHTLAQGHDDIYARKIRIEAEASGFTSYTITEVSDPIEAVQDGRNIKIWYDERAFAQGGTLQLTGNADELLLPPNYIDTSLEYTVHAIDLYHEDVVNNDHIHNQTRIWILLDSGDDYSTTDAATGVTTSTNDTTTVASLNSGLGVWLESNDPFALNGEAAAGALFV